MLNDQSVTSPHNEHNEPQRSPGFVQKQQPEMFCEKVFLKVSQISQESTCVWSFKKLIPLKFAKSLKASIFQEHLKKTASI